MNRTSPIAIWLEVDLDTQPIGGTLTLPGGSPMPFVGWLGLTAALARLRGDEDEEQAREAD